MPNYVSPLPLTANLISQDDASSRQIPKGKQPLSAPVNEWAFKAHAHGAWHCRHIVIWPSDTPLFVRGVASAKQSGTVHDTKLLCHVQ